MVDISNPDDWGGGLLSYEVSFECEAGLYFLVYRGNTDQLPSWVSISWGHPEDHYLEATGDVALFVEGTVTEQVDLLTVEGSSPGFLDWKLEPDRIVVSRTP